MRAANGADWLLAALAEQGMAVLFGNPGSTELPLTDALGRQGRVRYVHRGFKPGDEAEYADLIRSLVKE